MSALKPAIAWGVVAAVGFLVGRWLAAILASDVNSAILLTVGALGALVNATSFQVLRRLDDSPAKLLSPAFAARLERKLEKRRQRFRRKWAAAIAAGIGAALCGGLLKAASLAAVHSWITSCGYAAVALSVTLGVLIVLEYSALSKLAKELPKHLQAKRDKDAMLERLRPGEPGFDQPLRRGNSR